MQLYFYLGAKVANAPKLPTWNTGDEFEAARKKALAVTQVVDRFRAAKTSASTRAPGNGESVIKIFNDCH